MTKKETGDAGEKLAQRYLKKQGYRILETNYLCPVGEIDIVSLHKKVLVFTEVRTRTSNELGTPEESITPLKRSRMRKAAFHYLGSHKKLPDEWRIDVLAVELTPEGKTSRIELIESAVGEEPSFHRRR